MRDMWIIAAHGSNGPIYWEGDKPRLWALETFAQLFLLLEYKDTLTDHIDEFQNGIREFDEIDTSPDEYVLPCTVHDDGVITTEFHDPFYDPKTYVR